MYEALKRNDLHPLPVSMTLRSHLFSYRTQKLSSVVQKVLGWTRPGRICRCRFPKQRHTRLCMSFVFIFRKLILRTYKCPANKNLQIVTLSISISRTLFGDYGKYASKKKKRLFIKNVKICKKEHSTESEGI